MFQTFQNITDQQKKMLLFVGINALVFFLLVAYIVRSTQAMKAYARAMNAFADSIEDGGPVTINVAQFKPTEHDRSTEEN